MKSRPLFKNPLLWITSTGFAVGIIAACSSSTTPSGGTSANCTPGVDTVACTCPDGTASQGKCNDPSSCQCGQTNQDSGPVTEPDSGKTGDGGHVDDGASPSTLYSACARTGSFGFPCTTPNAMDTAECTDPNFPYCFGGGQGYWCTASCAVADGGADGGDAGGGFAACLVETPDGAANQGCLPTACNNKGWCK